MVSHFRPIRKACQSIVTDTLARPIFTNTDISVIPLHATRYSECGTHSSQHRDDQLQDCFPCFLFHLLFNLILIFHSPVGVPGDLQSPGKGLKPTLRLRHLSPNFPGWSPNQYRPLGCYLRRPKACCHLHRLMACHRPR